MNGFHPAFRLPESSLAGYDHRSADLARYSAVLAALANESRILILRFLLRRYPAALSVGEIVLELSIPPSVLTVHLECLCGAVQILPDSDRENRYRANVQLLSDLVKLVFPLPAQPGSSPLLDPPDSAPSAEPRSFCLLPERP